MRARLVLLAVLLSIGCLPAQRVINKQWPAQGNIQLTDEIAIPTVDRGYTLWLPDTGKIEGLIVFTHSRRDTAEADFIIEYALSRQLAVLYATTENRLEFFFEPAKMREIEGYIQEVVTQYGVPEGHLLYCGMSLEGTRALKLALFGQSAKSEFKLQPRAIAICDAPLDMVRFHREMVKARELQFTPVTANEGTWVSGYLERHLGGTPQDTLAAYLDYSPYSNYGQEGHKLDLFNEIAIRCYTEPDVQWWMETRGKDYYAMNALDLAAFVNALNLNGHPNAELIITHDRGFLPDGTRHPHSWSIVDERELIDWFMDLIK